MTLPQMLKRSRRIAFEIAKRSNIFRQLDHAFNLHQIECSLCQKSDVIFDESERSAHVGHNPVTCQYTLSSKNG
jgi:hypothetical protein